MGPHTAILQIEGVHRVHTTSPPNRGVHGAHTACLPHSAFLPCPRCVILDSYQTFCLTYDSRMEIKIAKPDS